MPQVDNQLYEESFSFYKTGERLGDRIDDLLALEEVCEYCQEIGEKILYSSTWYEVEVDDGIDLATWLYSGINEQDVDMQRMLMQMLENFSEEKTIAENVIDISLGNEKNCVSTEKEYVLARRKILETIKNPQEYAKFMSSCYRNCVFADNIEKILNKISHFQENTKEITYNLSLLNDEALQIYRECGGNQNEAIKMLAAKALDCSRDPNHKQFLKFPFSYLEEVEGKASTRIKEVLCEPHLKLIRKDSDLRIYFAWNDEEIGDGEKVLVGRIGSHAY